MIKNKSKITIMGLGYIGLPTASILATKGHQVLGVDVNSKAVDTINKGEIHIVEPDLDILVKSAVNSGQLKAAMKPEKADVFFLCVPTPFHDDMSANLDYIEAATKSIAPLVEKGNLVVLESTSPPLTTRFVGDIIDKHAGLSAGEDYYLVHAPERVLPGNILKEAVGNDRVIGGINKESAMAAKTFYESFVTGEIYLTDDVTAEMSKLVENTSRDVQIAFANELSIISDKLNIDVYELIDLANKHPRVDILQPGPGVGGHCIAVDPWFIVDKFPEETRLIRSAREVNLNKPNYVVEKVAAKANKFKKPVIGCLGLAYKANIDDLRESPSVEIYHKLTEKNIGEVIACEPNIPVGLHEKTGIKNFPLDEVLDKSDILVLLVDNKEFKEINYGAINEKVIIDTKGLWRK